MLTISQKSVFIMSILALVVCVSLLVGTTFAWFTDSVTSGGNKIVAGNMDILLEYYDEAAGCWLPVEEDTALFDDEALWEPGYTHQVALRIANAGSLALKYQLTLAVTAETAGVNTNGESFKLSDHIRFGVMEYEGLYPTREDALTAAQGVSTPLTDRYVSTAKVLDTVSDTEDYVTLVVYMPDSVGNTVNSLDDANRPHITIALNLAAMQANVEADDFGNDYDGNALVDGAGAPQP